MAGHSAEHGGRKKFHVEQLFIILFRLVRIEESFQPIMWLCTPPYTGARDGRPQSRTVKMGAFESCLPRFRLF